MVYAMIFSMDLIADELKAVDEQLYNIETENNVIGVSLKNFLAIGSKRIRTSISALYLKACGKEISKDSIKVMTAGELIHNASLLHDDVLDNAETRRGKQTFAKQYSPHIAILSGNYLLSIATEKLREIENPDILTIFLNCTREMCVAEMNQFILRGKTPSLDEYLHICEGKTAKLFEEIIRSCALIEGEDSEAATYFARNFGILFQLKNDLETSSAKSDALNRIYTPKDFLGIEKTLILIDNYHRKVLKAIDCLPDSKYKKGLEELLSKL